MREVGSQRLLTPAEVGAGFHVDPKTVTRWANAGKLSPLFTLGGQRRYRADEVERLLDEARSESSLLRPLQTSAVSLAAHR